MEDSEVGSAEEEKDVKWDNVDEEEKYWAKRKEAEEYFVEWKKEHKELFEEENLLVMLRTCNYVKYLEGHLGFHHPEPPPLPGYVLGSKILTDENGSIF